MLQTNHLKPRPGTTNPTIAGNAGGKRVLCSNQALPIFNDLVKLSRSGNHWAGIIVKAITGLSAGKLHLDNIFIEEKKSLAYGKGAFHLVLPGVTASLDELPNGSYILQHIKTDTNYQILQEQSQKPGLWRVRNKINLKPELQKDGMILNKEYRPVVISDMATSDAIKISKIARNDLIKTDGTIKNMVRDHGFDMHHTPGGSAIIGLKKAKKALSSSKDKDIVQSAMLLANTMYKARNINGVLWYSDWGGSAVLTRAMQILHKEKGIKLDKHSIFLNRPTSSPKQAIELAEMLGITPNADGKNTGLHPSEIRGHIAYTDVTAGGTLKATGFGLSAAGATFAFAGASLTTSGIVGLAGGMFFVANTVKSSAKNLKGKQYK